MPGYHLTGSTPVLIIKPGGWGWPGYLSPLCRKPFLQRLPFPSGRRWYSFHVATRPEVSCPLPMLLLHPVLRFPCSLPPGHAGLLSIPQAQSQAPGTNSASQCRRSDTTQGGWEDTAAGSETELRFGWVPLTYKLHDIRNLAADGPSVFPPPRRVSDGAWMPIRLRSQRKEVG